ncbi:hypothetical protein EBS80_04480 [bacterium]|nr:hypothetical protein [bacterium]
MNTFIPGPLADTARNLLRRAGYGEHRGHEAQLSYTKRIQGSLFPRYHAYVEDRDGGMQLNLHLDQKEASYGGGHAHSGEYAGPLVERENARIVAFVKSLRSESEIPTTHDERPMTKKSSGGFFSWLMGE